MLCRSLPLSAALVAGLFLASLVGCDTGPADFSSPGATRDAPDFSDAIVEPDAVSLVDLTVEFSGTFAPGEPVTVTPTVVAPEIDVPVTVTVSAPELERMRDGVFFDKAGSGEATRMGRRHEPVHQHTERLARGGSTSDAATLTFSEPGLYTIEVSAQADLSNVDLPPGSEYADGARTTRWVWIGENGRALDRPDLSVIPDGYVGALGPARTPDEAPAFAPSAPSSANKSGTAPFQVIYWKYNTTGDTPLPGVRVVTVLPSGQILSNVTTDANGMAYFTCHSGGAYDVYVFTEGIGKINVYYDSGYRNPNLDGPIAARVSNLPCAPRSEPANRAMANTLEGMRAIEDLYSTEFGYDRGPVDVYLKPGDANGLYSLYNNISMGDARLGSERGFHLWAHEYGHAFHHRALGGMPRGRCGASHYFNGADDYGCAYTEGFAHFTSAVAFDALYFDLYGLSPTRSNRYHETLNNLGYPGSPGNSDRPDYIDDGGLIEGAFAAFMWDLYDSPNMPGETLTDESTFDLTSYPLSYIADVIRTCRYDSHEEDGTDRLISCFEGRRVPYSSQFFRLRYEEGGDNYNVSESATEPPGWDPEHIRTLWRKNLYGVGPQPITVAVNGPMYLASGERGTWWGGVSGASDAAVYQWQTRTHREGDSGSGGPTLGDAVEIWGLWTNAGNGTSFSKLMYPDAERLDVKLTVTDNGRAGSNILTVYRTDD